MSQEEDEDEGEFTAKNQQAIITGEIDEIFDENDEENNDDHEEMAEKQNAESENMSIEEFEMSFSSEIDEDNS